MTDEAIRVALLGADLWRIPFEAVFVGALIVIAVLTLRLLHWLNS